MLSAGTPVSAGTALLYTLVLGLVIFFCRVLPFIIFRDETGGGAGHPGIRSFLDFVEALAPPVAMTVLAFNVLASPVRDLAGSLSLEAGGRGFAGNLAPFLAGLIPLAAGSLFTAAVHLWKRDALISVFGGTALYMALGRILG
ncbi:MAG: AzlD domain-containing protein [Treponema sp.]|jgi:branched-subunit amino acid transport protein AzlD|nr:AzlD domain-containing protein [Treponema sp.]